MEDAFAIFNEVLNDGDTSSGGDVCLISGLPLDNTLVTLPCGHKFKYLPLLEDILSFASTHCTNVVKCPYCRGEVRGTIPYRPDVIQKRRKYINMPVCDCFNKHACTFDDCTTNATIPIGDVYACYRHYRKVAKTQAAGNATACSAILKTGKRKGEICGVRTKTGLCKRHEPK